MSMFEIPTSSNEIHDSMWRKLPSKITAWVRSVCHKIVHDPIEEIFTPALTQEILAVWENALEEDDSRYPQRRPYDMEEYNRRIAVLSGILAMHYTYLCMDADGARQVRYRLIEAAGLVHYT